MCRQAAGEKQAFGGRSKRVLTGGILGVWIARKMRFVPAQQRRKYICLFNGLYGAQCDEKRPLRTARKKQSRPRVRAAFAWFGHLATSGRQHPAGQQTAYRFHLLDPCWTLRPRLSHAWAPSVVSMFGARDPQQVLYAAFVTLDSVFHRCLQVGPERWGRKTRLQGSLARAIPSGDSGSFRLLRAPGVNLLSALRRCRINSQHIRQKNF